ncbi:MAG: aminoacyl-tRNA hydrolase [Victivallaceae bacterium]
MAEKDLCLLVGIGNPGLSFAQTRHNLGFAFVDYVVDCLGGIFVRKTALKSYLAKVSFEDKDLLIAKPLTFVNLSGNSLGILRNRFNLESDRIMIAVDNVDKPFGKLSLKQGIGAGGHNGLRSVNQVLDFRNSWVLKMGIGRPLDDSKGLADFVLGRFSFEEQGALPMIFEEAIILVKEWLLHKV